MHYDFNQVITRHHTNSVKYDCAKYFVLEYQTIYPYVGC